MEKEVNGDYFRLDQIELLPGGEVQALVRLPVSGDVGQRAAYHFDLYSNDPASPFKRVTFVVSSIQGGLDVIPNPIFIGRLQLGRTHKQEILLYDTSPRMRKIRSVKCTGYEKTQVRFEPAVPASPLPRTSLKGCWLGTIYYEHQATQPGPFKHEVIVEYFDSDESESGVESIPVRGEVMNLAEIIPDTILLPRRTSQGWLQEATCKVRFSLDKPTQLDVLDVPDLFEVTIKNSDVPHHSFIIIKLKPTALMDLDHRSHYQIKLRAKCGDLISDLEINIHLQPQRGAS